MATEVVMPQMGESIAEGTITKWLAKVGDRVERDEPLFEISTDKVDAEIPSPATGVLLEIKHQEGETVAVDALVALIGDEGEQPAAGAEVKAAATASAAAPASAATAPTAAAPASPAAASPAAAPAATAPAAAAATVAAPPATASTATEPAAPSPAAESGAAKPSPGAAPAAAAGPAAPAAEPPAAARGPMSLEERLRTFSSPVVRRMATEHGVDLTQLEGTGIHGRVTKKDLEAHLEAQRQAPAPSAPAPSVPAAAARTAEVVPEVRRQPAAPGEFYVPAYVEGERVEIEPMSRIRQITAAHMIYSKRTSAHVTTVFHMDLSKVTRARERARHGFQKAHGTKLTYMPFIFKAVADALIANPKLNASLDGTDIVYKKDINIGMAVALDWGLIVPVIKHADGLNLVGLAKTANDLADRARTKKLSPSDVQGGTFTVTNPGVFGSLFGMPIINQPQVAILGIGTIEKRPVVVADAEGNDTIAIKSMSYFAITYDHRLVDGADADHFMNHVKRTLVEENWSELDAFV